MEEGKPEALVQLPIKGTGAGRILVVSVTGLAFLSTLFFMFAPTDRVQAVKASWHRMTNDPGQLCFDIHADSLKDPTTAQIIESKVYTDEVFVTYRAANSFGAFRKDTFVCPLVNGRFHKHKAEMAKLEAELENLRSGE